MTNDFANEQEVLPTPETNDVQVVDAANVNEADGYQEVIEPEENLDEVPEELEDLDEDLDEDLEDLEDLEDFEDLDEEDEDEE